VRVLLRVLLGGSARERRPERRVEGRTDSRSDGGRAGSGESRGRTGEGDRAVPAEFRVLTSLERESLEAQETNDSGGRHFIPFWGE
jgi:hypothetical protein